MVAFSISWSLADARSAQNVGNQSMGDGDVSINSESSKDNAARDLLSSSSAAASMKDGDPQLVLENQMSPRGDEEKDSKFVNENNDKDGRVLLTTKSAINDGSAISEHPPGTEKGRMASDGSKDRTGNSPNEGKSIPAYGGEYLSGMEWILQKVIGDSGLANDSTGDVQKENNKDSVKQNKTTDLLHSGNVTAASATVGISSNSANITTINNASSSQSTNASHSYKVSGSNATNVTNSNSTSPNKSPSGGSSAALTLVKLLLASLYVAGPSAGIFLISPIYAIATRNLMDYFIGSPETVDLLHGAGILGLVVDLTWGAVD